jgi:hypothetical protein
MKKCVIALHSDIINKRQEKHNGDIKNGRPRDTGNIGTRHRAKINKNKNTQHRKHKKWSNTNPI